MKKIIIINATKTTSYQEFRVLNKFNEYSLYDVCKENSKWSLYERVRGEKNAIENGITYISEAHKLAFVHANK
jgi:hypothetical protein